MKPIHLYYRLFIYAAMVLSIFHPTLQMTAATSLSATETSEQLIFIGRLENGLNYTLIPSSKLQGGVWIKLSCSIPNMKDFSSVSLLTQHAGFYGTHKFDRQQIANKLHHFGLDVEADSYIVSNESETSIQFCLSQSHPDTIRELLTMLNQITFSPTFKLEDVEVARNHLLSSVKESEETVLPIQSVTLSEMRKFHSQWFRPEYMHLTFMGSSNPEDVVKILCEAFESPVHINQHLPTPSEKVNTSDASDLIERVDWTEDHQYRVVDGKIWMNEPNWINKSSNGRTLGAVLTVLGIGGMILAFPIIAPLAIVAGSLTTATGIYFLSSSYLKDPYYIESVRQIDLQKGCAFAYKNSRAGMTLTPYERRALFLQEMVDHPQTLPKLPILLLADLYQLNDPVIAEIFTVDEFNVLTRLKRDFVLQRNQYKLFKESLERELAAITAPYALARDAALLHAQDVYNQNYYVFTKNTLKIERDQSIAQIEEAYKNQDISLTEKESLIEQANAYYESCISSPDFKAGLNAAERSLAQMELEIETTYAYQVELCKQSIQYNQRMDYYNQGENSIRIYFNQELIRLLATFPVYLPVLPDYLDLRTL